MSRSPKIDRARRNVLKAASLVLGAVVATSASHKLASAQVQPSVRPVPVRSSCFARGTQIRTRDGYRPIETLAVGDEVAVRSGGFASIKAMVGHTLNRVSGKWDGDPNNLPVLMRRGALGESSPNADLCVTALHAVYVYGFLMQVGDLVNGTTIAFEPADGRDPLDFLNIELDGHDILDVQGAFCESLYRAGTERCAPLLGFDGGRSKLRSHMRSVASLVVDRRQPIDIIRDNLEDVGSALREQPNAKQLERAVEVVSKRQRSQRHDSEPAIESPGTEAGASWAGNGQAVTSAYASHWPVATISRPSAGG